MGAKPGLPIKTSFFSDSGLIFGETLLYLLSIHSQPGDDMVSRTTDGTRFSDGVSSAVVRRALVAPAAIIAPGALISIIIIRQTTR